MIAITANENGSGREYTKGPAPTCADAGLKVEQIMPSIRSLILLLLINLIFTLVAACSLQAQDESTMTGREYFSELKEGGGIPKWATNVCFPRVFEETPGKSIDASGSSEFFLMGDDAPTTKFQSFARGVGENVLIVAREFRDESTSRFAGRLVLDGEPNHFQFGISWSTGRFSLTETRGITSGVCHAIE